MAENVISPRRRGHAESGGDAVYYLLLYDVVADYIERRGAFRDAHLALIRAAHARGELLMAGAFADPIDGAALLFQTSDPAVVERFARHDPYVQNGLVTAWRVRRWVVVVGDRPDARPLAPEQAAGAPSGC